MSIESFLSEAERATEGARLNRPRDIDGMLRRNLGIDKNLATSVLCFGDAYSVKDDAWSWYTWGAAGREGTDVIARYAAQRLRASSAAFRDCYACQDTASLLEHGAEAMAEVTAPSDLARVAYAVNHYMILIYYWVDASFPWAELSPAHAALIRSNLSRE